MKKWMSLMVLALLALCASGAWAADNESEYLIGPEDILEITVANHADLNQTVTVLPDGTIGFSEAGQVKAAGKTPKALADEIKTLVEQTRKRVSVVVAVKEVHSQRVRVVGAVKNSGNYELKRNWRLLDAIAMAGGLSTKPTRVNGRILRGTKVVQLDLVQAVTLPDGDANPLLTHDDLVILDEVDIVKQIHVLGQVTKPGPFDLTEGLNIIQLISQAGGITEKAALGQAYLLRGEEKIALNLVPVLLQNKTDDIVAKMKLKTGDVLMIPETEAKFAVLGQVTKPGYYPLPERAPTSVVEALSYAGGETQEADIRRAGLLRVVNGKATTIPVNISDILRRGNLAKNVPIEKGDILFIPTRSRRVLSFGDFLSPITTILSFGILR